MGDQMNIGENLRAYTHGFAPVVRASRGPNKCRKSMNHKTV